MCSLQGSDFEFPSLFLWVRVLLLFYVGLGVLFICFYKGSVFIQDKLVHFYVC